MIKIYSNQQNSGIFESPNEIVTTDSNWWMIYDENTKEIIIPPQICSGKTSSPFTMVVSDSEEELNSYIEENNLTIVNIDTSY
jgi:hypothetical protein